MLWVGLLRIHAHSGATWTSRVRQTFYFGILGQYFGVDSAGLGRAETVEFCGSEPVEISEEVR